MEDAGRLVARTLRTHGVEVVFALRRTVVFAKGGSSNTGIYVYNRADGTTRQISSTTKNHRGTPRISGSIVVWEDERSGSGKQDIWGYDLATRQQFQVTKGGDDQSEPDISGLTLVWQDESNNGDVRGADLVASGAPSTPPPSGGQAPADDPASRRPRGAAARPAARGRRARAPRP